MGSERSTETRGLRPDELRRRYDPEALGFETSAEVEEVTVMIGQPRATAGLHFGIGMARDGYNIFALGAPGTGKRTFVLDALRRQARARPVPPDLCYVHNFEVPERPRLLRLPPGRGADFRRDVEELVQHLRATIAEALASESYQARRQRIEEEVKARPQQEIERLRQRAERSGIALVQAPEGVTVAATRDGAVLSEEAFERLPDDERRRVQAALKTFEEEIARILRQVPKWVRERHDRLEALRREVIHAAVDPVVEEAGRGYASVPGVVEYLEAVRGDVIEHAEELGAAEPSRPETLLDMLRRPGPESPRRYRVNVLIDHTDAEGAPVVYEDHPTYDNLLGRIEYAAQFGALVTDHTLIKAGALHRANGGYLVVEAHKLLQSPYAWDALKRALRSRRLRMESLGQALSLISTVSLEPEPAPLEVQVVLLGDPILYYLLSALDPDFGELFKVAADFDDAMTATPELVRDYTRLIATLARRSGLRPVHRTGIARLLEESARWAGHRDKLSARVALLRDLLLEADHWAGAEGAEAVTAAHVQRAIDAQVHRADRIRERLYEEIARRTLLIDTEEARVGQVNGLSVASLGHFSFGRPIRITARVRLGRGDVTDIEREVELGGPLHSKGVLILSGYLGARYVSDRPLALGATLVFEQSYSGVEGDSASAAELFALLSAIAETPLRQSLAVTGSVNQHGEVQAVDGINEKIEGFFDVCRARGLTGEQGVIVPAANVQHLMLRPDVIEAVAAARFHVHAIRTVDEGLELLTGLPAGERDASGAFPEESFNRRVESRLIQFAETWPLFGAAPDDGTAG